MNSSVLVIPEGVKPIGINVTVMVTENSVYPCDSWSVIRELSSHFSGEGTEACNGVFLYKEVENWYNAIIGNKKTIINLTNYTAINTVTNGLLDNSTIQNNLILLNLIKVTWTF